MADEKVNVSPKESKTPEAPAPSGPGNPPAQEHTKGPVRAGRSACAGAHRGARCSWWRSGGSRSCRARPWGTYPADCSPRYG